jgi:hypothetical protein
MSTASTFTFPPFNTANLSTGTFYAHLVTTIPNINNTLVSDLVLSVASGYTPVLLSGVALTATKWSANNITFPIYNFTTPVVGVVICKQVGTTPANTDPILAYSDLANSLSQNVTSGNGNVNLFVDVATNGMVTYTDNYIYSSGSNALDQSVPYGLIYMLGTTNNTGSYINPLTSAKIIASTEAGSSSAGFDRSLVSSTNLRQNYGFDFTKFTVRVGGFAVYVMTTSTNVILWGSNSPSAWNTAYSSNTGWTALTTATPLIANQWTTLTSTNDSYWKYLRLSSNNSDISLQEIEMYNSFILSPTANMV